MPANYSITTRSDGETVTAAKYNADHQNHIDHMTPAYIDDYSSDLSQMRSQVTPGAVGSESLATTQAGEIERLRYAIYQAKLTFDPTITYWYDTVPTFNIYNVESYGASEGGTASANATAINAALTAAAASNGCVYVPGDYPITTVSVPNGVRSIYGPGTFVGTGVYGNAVVELSGTVINLDFSLSINMNSLAKTAIYGVAQSCRFHHMNLTGFPDVNGHCGINLRPDSSYVRIDNNLIFLYQPPLTTNYTGLGIAMVSNITDNYGTYFSSGTGASEDPSTPVHHITINGNVIFGGSHAIFGQGIRDCTISGNSIQRSWHRGIALEPSCKRNTIAGNTITDFYSSAVLLAYGAQYNTVAGNTCTSTLGNGQAAINLYVGVTGNVVTGNTIHLTGIAPLYGIYCSVSAVNNLIANNRISGHRLAGIAHESDWVTSGGAPHTYSGILPGSPPSGSKWAMFASAHNVISNNLILEPTTGGSIAGIFIAAVTTNYGTTANVIKDNHVVTTNHTHLYYVGESDPSYPVSSLFLQGNTWSSGVAISLGPRGQGHYQLLKDNALIDQDLFFAFADGDTTPDVTLGVLFSCANTGSTTITDFDGTIIESREITVRMDVNTGITHDNAKVRLLGGTNITVGTVDSNFFIHFINIGGVWFELWRRN